MKIKLQNSEEKAIVDGQFYPLLSQHRWFRQSEGYARASIGGRGLYMHQLILASKRNTVIDHLNFNRLDNRKSNLQLLTNSENLNRSRSKSRKDLGVSFHVASNKWRARLTHKNSEVYIGVFKTKKEAIKARENKLKELV